MSGCILSVNLNAVAHMRNRRDVGWPNVQDYGRKTLQAGAKGLTIHPRPDQRHIRHSDVYELADLFKQSEFHDCEFNIEGYPDKRFMDLILEVRPHQVTLVPDSPEQSTSDHGWDFEENHSFLTEVVAEINKHDMRSATFVDPTPQATDAAAAVGVKRVEIYTGPFGAKVPDVNLPEARAIIDTHKQARKNGLGVNAGHDLTLANMAILSQLEADIDEVSIGHGFWSDAWLYGLEKTVSLFADAAATLHPEGRK